MSADRAQALRSQSPLASLRSASSDRRGRTATNWPRFSSSRSRASTNVLSKVVEHDLLTPRLRWSRSSEMEPGPETTRRKLRRSVTSRSVTSRRQPARKSGADRGPRFVRRDTALQIRSRSARAGTVNATNQDRLLINKRSSIWHVFAVHSANRLASSVRNTARSRRRDDRI